jgi:large subunit ribosomal protein L6
VVFPKNVSVAVSNGEISFTGPLGEISRALNPSVAVSVDGSEVRFAQIENAENSKALSGTMRALVANMVLGVTQGFERKLMLVGVGFKAQAQGDKLNLSLGFSHPVVHSMPAGIKVETPVQTEIRIKGIDKQLVGQVAAEIRAYRQPEPYKGKGVRYSDEVVVIKETKKK